MTRNDQFLGSCRFVPLEKPQFKSLCHRLLLFCFVNKLPQLKIQSDTFRLLSSSSPAPAQPSIRHIPSCCYYPPTLTTLLWSQCPWTIPCFQPLAHSLTHLPLSQPRRVWVLILFFARRWKIDYIDRVVTTTNSNEDRPIALSQLQTVKDQWGRGRNEGCQEGKEGRVKPLILLYKLHTMLKDWIGRQS